MLKAVQLVRRLRPEAVLGVGGYAGGPVVLVAALLGMPDRVLEPNAKPGFTNRVLKPFVRHAACSYEEARREFGSKGVVTGNPVRGGFASCPASGTCRPSRCSPSAAARARASSTARSRRRCRTCPGPTGCASSTRRARRCGTRWRRPTTRPGARREVLAFLDDMEARFAQADLVLCRSGATTCAELTAAGKASVLVPFAQAADDHQRGNARAMEAAGAARMIEEKDLTRSGWPRSSASCSATPPA